MTIYKPPDRKTYRYDFEYRGKRYAGNTHQQDEERAQLVESKLKLKLREQRGGIAEPGPAPAFSDWAEVYFAWCERMQTRTGRPKRLDRIEELLRVVLRFWGKRPASTTSLLHPTDGEEAPFHDLTLRDPIEDPTWILEFDAWMDRRKVAGSTRNHYNSVLSRLYFCAMLPDYRKLTGILFNPFAGRPRAPKATRKVALTPERVIAWLDAMSYHTRLAVSIAALAPKLRLQNVLALDRAEHFDPALTVITVHEHKSDRITHEPLIVPVSAQLRAILVDAFARNGTTTRVVTYRGQPVESIRGGLRAAARQAGIPYGRYTPGGVTFHTLRHTASTIFARLKVNPWVQRDAMGHQDLQTTAGYTHLQVEEQRPALEQLSAELPLLHIVTKPQRRAVRTVGQVAGPVDPASQKHAQKRAVTRGAMMTIGAPYRRKFQ
jgi:integrase